MDTTPAQAAHLPSGLDFFGSSSAAGPSTSKADKKLAVKAKARTQAVENSDESEEDDEDSAPEGPTLAPPMQKISLSGPTPLPTSFTSFDTLVPSHLSKVVRNLRKNGVTQIWGVQGAVSGAFMSKEQRDVLVIAPTGSGKTLSYLLPLVVKLDQPCRTSFKAHQEDSNVEVGEQGIRSIILVPTHELALQIYGEVQTMLFGGSWRALLLEKATEAAVVTASQPNQLGIDVLVATPERLHHLVDQGKIGMRG